MSKWRKSFYVYRDRKHIVKRLLWTNHLQHMHDSLSRPVPDALVHTPSVIILYTLYK